MIKACLNGARRPSEHPALPVTPTQLGIDAARAAGAGAGAVHLHAKDADGSDTLAPAAVAAAVAAVRAFAPGVPVGVTTGAWAQADPAARVAAVRGWTTLPDFASVNWHEDGADAVAAALLARGVDVEAGLWHADAIRAWIDSPHRDGCLRALVELRDGDDVALADRLLGMVPHAYRGPVLLHGEGASAWPTLRRAGELGLDTRIGLEDTLVLPDGSPAPDNVALLEAARALLRG